MYYKLYYLIAFLIFSTQFSFSQVTMGTVTPPAQGTLLDLKEKDTTDGGANSTRGLNLPRVSLIAIDQLEPCAQTNSTNNKAHTGLIVYNTTDNSETDNTLTPGANITFTFALKAGDTVRPVIFQNTGSDLTLRVYSSTDPGGAGFNNISIVEL